MNITSETVKSAMTKTLALQYPEVTLYKNKVAQGMKKPCFFVTQLEPKMEKVSKNRFKITYLMCIRYHKDNASRADLDSVGFNLMDIFDTLVYDDRPLTFGKNIRYEIIDEVLQFFVTYELTVIKPVESIKMQSLDFKEGIK